MSIYFGNPSPLKCISDAVMLYGSKEFKSPTRSTIPMLSMLIHSRKTFDDIIKVLGMPSDSNLFLEYTVAPPQGRGKPSHTDAMLISGEHALAIEAKWTEPMYESVGTWINKGENLQNRIDVLNGWLGLLRQPEQMAPLNEDCTSLIYQMVHRAASVAATSNNPKLAYFCFSPSPDKQTASSEVVFQELTKVWTFLGKPQNFEFSVVKVEMKALNPIQDLLPLKKQEAGTSKAVVKALAVNSPALFEFTDFEIRKVGGTE